MNANTPGFNAELVHICTAMSKTLQDDRMSENPSISYRYRKMGLLFNEELLQAQLEFDINALYDEALKVVAVELKDGYGYPVASMEELDHQARDWICSHIEQLWMGTHPWRQALRDNPEATVVFWFGFGSLEKPGVKKHPLLPLASRNLFDYTNVGDNEPGVLLENEVWDLSTHGNLVGPDILTQFGRPSDEGEPE